VSGGLGEFQYAVDTTLGVPATRIVPVHGTRGAEAPPNQRIRLGEALVQAGVITAGQLEHCLRYQEAATPRRRLGAVVVELGLASDVDVARGLGTTLGFEFVDPSAMEVPLDVVHRVPRLSAEMLGVVPISAGQNWLRVAVADPTDRFAVESLREATGVLTISMAVATPRSIEVALHRFWSPEYAPAGAAAPPAAPAAPLAAVPDAAPATPEPTVVAVEGGWEYAFVGDGVPSSHAGYTGDLAGTERELARLGALGWEAVGVTTAAARMTVLLKRPSRDTG
jgi:MshEN domain